MPKRTRLNADSYKPLMKSLQRANYAKSGLLARILLEAFVLDQGHLAAETCVAAGLVEKGRFSDLRSRLKRDGFIAFTEQSVQKRQYFPTARMLPHIEAARRTLYPTLEQVEQRIAPVEHDVADLKDRMAKIERTVSALQDAMEPPITAAKRKAARTAVATLAVLAKH